MRAPLLAIPALLLLLLLTPTASAAHLASLQEGDFTRYVTPYRNAPILAVFDDGAEASMATLNYSWTALQDEGDSVRVRIDLTLDIPLPATPQDYGGGITYFGNRSAEAARRGDFSFVRRFPFDAETLPRVQIINYSGPDALAHVFIPGPFRVERHVNATVSLANGTVTWEGDARRGTWTLWVDPHDVPTLGTSERPLARLIPHGPHGGALRHVDRDTGNAALLHLLAPGLERWVEWGVPRGNLTGLGLESPRSYDQTYTYAYDERTGFFVAPLTGRYADDTLATQLGLVHYKTTPTELMLVHNSSREALLWAFTGAPPKATPGPGHALTVLGLLIAAAPLAARKTRR